MTLISKTKRTSVAFAGKLVSQEKSFGRKTGLVEKLVRRRNWLVGKTNLAGTLVWQRNWSGSETVVAGELVYRGTGLTAELVFQGNWFARGTGLKGKLVWQGNLFPVNHTNISIILMVKQVIYITKVIDITVFYFFKNNCTGSSKLLTTKNTR